MWSFPDSPCHVPPNLNLAVTVLAKNKTVTEVTNREALLARKNNCQMANFFPDFCFDCW